MVFVRIGVGSVIIGGANAKPRRRSRERDGLVVTLPSAIGGEK